MLEPAFNLEKLIALRHHLHRNPELSGREYRTAAAVSEFITPFKPDRLIENIGKTGTAAVFDSMQPGPTVLFRADIDALPIQEDSPLCYRSQTQGVAHLCGHDGHTALLCGLAECIARNRPEKGRAVLLFQPAEETARGARAVIDDPLFYKIKPDYAFALHNLPGFPENTLIGKPGIFTCASRGLIVRLYGRTAHASEPEKGISPARTVSRLIETFLEMDNADAKPFTRATVIHARLGSPAFGTAPENAVVMATLRSESDRDMAKLFNRACALCEKAATCDKVRVKTEETEVFPATLNSVNAQKMVESAAKSTDCSFIEIEKPFPWSEDFSFFTQICHGALFGLGAGIATPPLHTRGYDFPDRIIPAGIRVFFQLFSQLLRQPQH